MDFSLGLGVPWVARDTGVPSPNKLAETTGDGTTIQHRTASARWRRTRNDDQNRARIQEGETLTRFTPAPNAELGALIAAYGKPQLDAAQRSPQTRYDGRNRRLSWATGPPAESRVEESKHTVFVLLSVKAMEIDVRCPSNSPELFRFPGSFEQGP